MATKQAKWESFVSLAWYDGFISFLFRFVSKTAEPLLCIGVIISAADFLQHGQLMARNAELADAWSWTQALAIEASTGPTFVFALQAFRANDKLKGWLYMALAGLLFIVGGSMLLLQLISNASGLGESNINAIVLYGLFVLRVVVASGIVALSCTKHMRFSGEDAVEQITVAAVVQAPVFDVASLADAVAVRLQPQMEQRIMAEFQQVKVTIEQAVTGEFPAINPAMLQAPPAREDANLLVNAPQVDDKDNNQAVIVKRFASKEQIIAAILERMPDASVGQVMQEAGCDRRTAQKWMEKTRKAI